MANNSAVTFSELQSGDISGELVAVESPLSSKDLAFTNFEEVMPNSYIAYASSIKSYTFDLSKTYATLVDAALNPVG